MKIKLLNKVLFALILVSVLGFGQKKTAKVGESFTISGTFKGTVSDNSYAYLYYNDKEDSVKIVNNKFEFKGIVKDTISAQIGMTSAANAPQFYLENSKIEINLSISDDLKDGKSVRNLHADEVKGSKSVLLSQEYMKFYQANKEKKDFDKLLYSKLKSFIPKHKSHPLSWAILTELTYVNPILTKKELNEFYTLLDSKKQNAKNLAFLRKGIDQFGNYGVGKTFRDFNLPDQDGNIIHFKDHQGKVILIDFWASWCKPCREKSPELRALNEEFSSSNFEIIGISADQNKKQWSGAIAKDKLNWVNVQDEGEKFKNTLGFDHYPYNYLIDEKGVIIGVNLSVSEIKQVLSDRKKEVKL